MRKSICSIIMVFVIVAVFVGQMALPGKADARRARVIKAGSTAAEKVATEPYKAFVVMDANSGAVLEEQNMHVRRAPASMTKLMVSYVVLDKLAKGEIHLTDTIPVSVEASKIGGSQVYLKAGETFALNDMMRAIVIASANDAAHAVSETVAGSNRDFVDLMNEEAKALGMNDTEFQSVHGLPPGKDQKEDLTSCYDMALLARALLKFPKMMEWSSAKEGDFRDGQFRLTNHNKLLWKMPEVDGLKTGFYRETGYNVTVTARRGDVRFITVVMGSSTAPLRDNFAMEKLRKWFAQYTTVTIAKKGERIDKEIILADGKFRKIKGIAAYDLTVPLLRTQKKDIQRVVNLPVKIKGEVQKGQKLGEMIVRLNNQVIGKVDIVSSDYVPKANFFTRMIRMIGLNI